MNPDRRIFVPADRCSEEELGLTCYEFANTLSGGKWNLPSRREIGIERYLAEEVEIGFSDEDSEINPLVLATHATFRAHKERFLDTEGNPVEDTIYEVGLTIGQAIDKVEIPSNILEAIRVKVEEKAEDVDGVVVTVDENGEEVDDNEIMRDEQITYHIDGDGMILGLDISHSYLYDDEVMHDTSYSTGEVQFGTVATMEEEGKPVELRPFKLEPLNKQQIDGAADEATEELLLLLNEDSLRHLMDIRGESYNMHIGRALSVLALVMTGFRIMR